MLKDINNKMEIFTFVWNQYLYTPLFNLLMWLYMNYSGFSMGVAIILLTVITRLALLPFSVLNEKSKIVSQRLRKELKDIKRDFADDHIKQKEMIRDLFRRKKIRPWSKAVVLGAQGLVLLLLYKVFIGGINSQENLQLLYSSIPRPDFINTNFLWFDIGERDVLLSALVGLFLFAQLIVKIWKRKKEASRKEQMFTVFFPVFVFLILAILPSAKALFVLTSLVVSAIISTITNIIKSKLKKNTEQPVIPNPLNQGPLK